ncbi:hypothetical protein [Paracoccus mutanolyticus]|uniref:hypothetical protein n=1 Tax=Paracoccus mutanolyticus TaxID=1499308 RepID=UPI00167B4C0C|nr:hypothetical protein [Paracoccus mutanolyticus]
MERNLAWLQDRHGDRIEPVRADIRDAARMAQAAREAKAVFHRGRSHDDDDRRQHRSRLMGRSRPRGRPEEAPVTAAGSPAVVRPTAILDARRNRRYRLGDGVRLHRVEDQAKAMISATAKIAPSQWPETSRDLKAAIHDVRRVDLFVSRPALLFTHIADQGLEQPPALRVPEHRAGGFLLER